MKIPAYLADQAGQSLATFLLLSTLSRTAGQDLVGIVAIVQSMMLVSTSLARSFGVDPWSALGGKTQSRKGWQSAPLVFFAVPLLLSIGLWVADPEARSSVLVYGAAASLQVLIDSFRIVLLHLGRSHWALLGQLPNLVWLVFGSALGISAELLLSGYLAGQLMMLTVTWGLVGSISLTAWMHELRGNAQMARDFSVEALLSAVAPQIVFFLIAAQMSLSDSASLRLAQTTIGPLSIVFAALSPILLRRFGKFAENSSLVRSSRRLSIIFSLISLLVGQILAAVLLVQVSERPIYQHIFGDVPDYFPLLVSLLALSTGINAASLVLGNTLRVLRLTGKLNIYRAISPPFQLIYVFLFAPYGSITLIALVYLLGSLYLLFCTSIVLRYRGNHGS